jgi:molybdopterin-guanine dinucleotide biosynthesis protein A
VVLAGGASHRFGRNKALARLDGIRLVDRVLAKAGAQTGRVVISGSIPEVANVEMIPDAAAGEGPLAGVLSVLCWARRNGHSAIATFSCDAPFFPGDLVVRLRAGMGAAKGSYACYRGQRHPAFALWPLASIDIVAQAYADGERSLMAMQNRIGAVAVEFPPGDGPNGDIFFNINRQADLVIAERWIEAETCDLA